MIPKVSVIVPMYNVDIYLRKCLDSLANQTLAELEVILINDGSTDYTEDIALEYVQKYSERFVYYKEEQSGQSVARNYGISLSHAPYIAFVDSDDYISPDLYQQMYDKAIEDDANIVCCGYDKVRSTSQDPDILETVDKYRFHAMHHSGHSVHEYPSILIEATCYFWNKMFSRTLLDRFQLPVGQVYEDSAIVYNILEAANRITFINEPGYFYRVKRQGSTTGNPTRITDIFKSMESIKEYYTQKGLAEHYSNELAFLCFRHVLYARTSQLKNATISFICHYIKEAYKYINSHYPNWQNNKYYLSDIPLTTPHYERRRLYYKNSNTVILYHVFTRVKNKIRRPAKKIRKIFYSTFGLETKRKNSQKSALSEEMLQELQTEQRQILNTIHTFCQQNNLRYYGAEGTLLGKIRHNGFIPWDDDMDLAMPRNDYEKLIILWGKQSISGCVLLAKETYKDYYLPFIKIVHNENIKYTSTMRKTPSYYQGLSIDIFPLDSTVACNTMKEVRRLRRIRNIRDMMLFKVNSLGSTSRKCNCIIHGVHFRSMLSLQNQLKRISMKYDGQDVPYLANFGSSYPPSREIFPREWWGNPKEGEFDDTIIMLPENGEAILNTIYGAYMEKPPEEKQICKHSYRRVDL